MGGFRHQRGQVELRHHLPVEEAFGDVLSGLVGRFHRADQNGLIVAQDGFDEAGFEGLDPSARERHMEVCTLTDKERNTILPREDGSPWGTHAPVFTRVLNSMSLHP